MARESQIQPVVRDWLARILAGAGAPAAAPLAAALAPEVERALRAAARDMLRQCSVAHFGGADEGDQTHELDVSVQETLMGAHRRVEQKRLDG